MTIKPEVKRAWQNVNGWPKGHLTDCRIIADALIDILAELRKAEFNLAFIRWYYLDEKNEFDGKKLGKDDPRHNPNYDWRAQAEREMKE